MAILYTSANMGMQYGNSQSQVAMLIAKANHRRAKYKSSEDKMFGLVYLIQLSLKLSRNRKVNEEKTVFAKVS
jgi:hypothetical protein